MEIFVLIRHLSTIVDLYTSRLVGLDWSIFIIWLIVFLVFLVNQRSAKPARPDIESQTDEATPLWRGIFAIVATLGYGAFSLCIHALDQLACSFLMTWCEDELFFLSFPAWFFTWVWIIFRPASVFCLYLIVMATLPNSGSECVDRLAKWYVMISFWVVPAIFLVSVVLFLITVVCSSLWGVLCSFARVLMEALPFTRRRQTEWSSRYL